MIRGNSGWENWRPRPRLGGDSHRLVRVRGRRWPAGALPRWHEEAGREPAEIAFDLLWTTGSARRSSSTAWTRATWRTILAVPWIAVCTDAEGRRAGHPILDEGVPHPRTYGSTARVLGRYVREKGTLPLETAIAKMTSVPARQMGLRDRGIVREGAIADLVVIDPAIVIDTATDEAPARYPLGIEHVIVAGEAAVLGGAETGRLTGRLIRGPR